MNSVKVSQRKSVHNLSKRKIRLPIFVKNALVYNKGSNNDELILLNRPLIKLDYSYVLYVC